MSELAELMSMSSKFDEEPEYEPPRPATQHYETCAQPEETDEAQGSQFRRLSSSVHLDLTAASPTDSKGADDNENTESESELEWHSIKLNEELINLATTAQSWIQKMKDMYYTSVIVDEIDKFVQEVIAKMSEVEQKLLHGDLECECIKGLDQKVIDFTEEWNKFKKMTEEVLSEKSETPAPTTPPAKRTRK